MKKISILGSTGSIGVQTLEVIKEHSDLFEVEVLTANNNSALLIEQSKKFKPNTVVITNEDKYKEVDDALFNLGIKVFAGKKSLEEVVEGESEKAHPQEQVRSHYCRVLVEKPLHVPSVDLARGRALAALKQDCSIL